MARPTPRKRSRAAAVAFDGTLCRVTCWELAHADALAGIANDRKVIKYLSARIPHPYERSDALEWIGMHQRANEPTHFAVEADGTLVGSIGFDRGTGERRGTAMIGYYFRPDVWGRGIATDAVRVVTAHLFASPQTHRVWANVMAPNAASARVLEKTGYLKEATLRAAILDRDGERHDELIYARTRR
ncbi:MAG: GNAT family N-acetyltransferase [Vulcanimicrobiaceae bacterium]